MTQQAIHQTKPARKAEAKMTQFDWEDPLHLDELLTEDEGRLTFRHDLIREAVRDTLPASARRALQRQAVDVLIGAGAPPVEVAVQLADSAEFGDQVAIRALHDAANAARQCW